MRCPRLRKIGTLARGVEALVKKVPHCPTIVPPIKGKLGSVKSGFGERWIRGQARVEESLFFKEKAKPV